MNLQKLARPVYEHVSGLNTDIAPVAIPRKEKARANYTCMPRRSALNDWSISTAD